MASLTFMELPPRMHCFPGALQYGYKQLEAPFKNRGYRKHLFLGHKTFNYKSPAERALEMLPLFGS